MTRSNKPTNFSKSFQELDSLAQELEQQDIDLEAAMPKFKKAAKLVKSLRHRLAQLENEITEISLEVDTKAN